MPKAVNQPVLSVRELIVYTVVEDGVTLPEPASLEPPEPAPAPPAAPVSRPAPAPKPKRWTAAPAQPASSNTPDQAPVIIAKSADDPKPAAEPAKPIDLPIPARHVDVPAPKTETPAPEPAKPRQPRTVTIPAGTLLTVRLNETLSSAHSEEGYNFHATLDAPLVVDGLVLAERGSQQTGRVVKVEKAGRVSGEAKLELELTELQTSDGQKSDIKTDPFNREGKGKFDDKRKVAMRTGIGAAMGAAIGAMIGGGKGAAIGAGAGAGGGAGSVLVTKGEDIQLGSETRISFRLKEPVTLTEKLP